MTSFPLNQIAGLKPDQYHRNQCRTHFSSFSLVDKLQFRSEISCTLQFSSNHSMVFLPGIPDHLFSIKCKLGSGEVNYMVLRLNLTNCCTILCYKTVPTSSVVYCTVLYVFCNYSHFYCIYLQKQRYHNRQFIKMQNLFAYLFRFPKQLIITAYNN